MNIFNRLRRDKEPAWRRHADRIEPRITRPAPFEPLIVPGETPESRVVSAILDGLQDSIPNLPTNLPAISLAIWRRVKPLVVPGEASEGGSGMGADAAKLLVEREDARARVAMLLQESARQAATIADLRHQVDGSRGGVGQAGRLVQEMAGRAQAALSAGPMPIQVRALLKDIAALGAPVLVPEPAA